MRLDACATVLDEAPQGKIHAQERDFGPGQIRLVAQHHFQALRAHSEYRARQTGAERDVHLVRVQHVNDGQQ